MYGLVVKLTAVPGKRDEIIAILKESAANMPGCLSYVLAKDSSDENLLWITEYGTAPPVTTPLYRFHPSRTPCRASNLSCQTSRESRSQLRSGAPAWRQLNLDSTVTTLCALIYATLTRPSPQQHPHQWHRHSCLP